MCGTGKFKIGHNLGQKGADSQKIQLLAILSKCFISFGRNLQALLENNFEDNDRDFGCRKVFIGHNLCRGITSMYACYI